MHVYIRVHMPRKQKEREIKSIQQPILLKAKLKFSSTCWKTNMSIKQDSNTMLKNEKRIFLKI